MVGSAGGVVKCRYAVEQLGFDECLDRRAPQLSERLAAACPDGIDVYFENVGGAVFEVVLPFLNVGARVPVCGAIAYYNEAHVPPEPNMLPRLLVDTVQKRIRMQKFIILVPLRRPLQRSSGCSKDATSARSSCTSLTIDVAVPHVCVDVELRHHHLLTEDAPRRAALLRMRKAPLQPAGTS